MGVYMPAPFTGFLAMRAGLTHDTFIEAFKITKDKENFKDTLLSDDMMEKINNIKCTMENDF